MDKDETLKQAINDVIAGVVLDELRGLNKKKRLTRSELGGAGVLAVRMLMLSGRDLTEAHEQASEAAGQKIDPLP